MTDFVVNGITNDSAAINTFEQSIVDAINAHASNIPSVTTAGVLMLTAQRIMFNTAMAQTFSEDSKNER